jgi:hypothetical protein
VKLIDTRLRSSGVTVVDDRLVEGAALGDAALAQRLAHLVGGKLLHAHEVDLRDRRALVHRNDEHVALDLHSHVAEETGREERADCLRGLLVGHRLADLDREVAEDGAGLDALDAFEADVADDEGLERERVPSEQQSEQGRDESLVHRVGAAQPEIRRFISL